MLEAEAVRQKKLTEPIRGSRLVECLQMPQSGRRERDMQVIHVRTPGKHVLNTVATSTCPLSRERGTYFQAS